MKLLRPALIFLTVLLVILTACETAEEEPLPTRVDPTLLAAEAGIIPQEDVDATLTAIAPPPTATPTSTDLPTDTLEPTATDTATDTPTVTPTEPPFIVEEPNRVIIQSDAGGSDDIWLVDFDGTNVQPFYVAQDSQERNPTCHPRGEAMMFDSDLAGDREIYIMEFPSLEPRPLTATEGENFEPHYSPPGDKVVFVSTRSGNWDIWMMDSGGGNIEQITTDEAKDFSPTWNLDGTKLYYGSERNGNLNLFEYSLETRVERQITSIDDFNERDPSLSPDGITLAFVSQFIPDDPNTASIYAIDLETEEVRLLILADRAFEYPIWLDEQTIIASTEASGEGKSLLRVNVVTNDVLMISPPSPSHQVAQLCYLPPEILDVLVQFPAQEPISNEPTESVPSTTGAGLATTEDSIEVTPTFIPSITPSPEPGTEAGSAFEPVQEAPPDWLFSTETWVAEEIAFIAPRSIQRQGLSAFLDDNLINLVWEDAEGSHVVSFALETFNGALEVTLIGYTLNDFPGDTGRVDGLDNALKEQLLVNSVRPGLYHLEAVEITDVNITFSFRTPYKTLPVSVSEYIPYSDEPPGGWLLSTERFTADEFAQMLSAAISVPVEVNIIGEQLQYRWSDGDGAHVLVVTLTAPNGDLAISTNAYTRNGQEASEFVPEDIIFLIREGILTYSLPGGQFQLARITTSDVNFEFLFVLPPKFLE